MIAGMPPNEDDPRAAAPLNYAAGSFPEPAEKFNASGAVALVTFLVCLACVFIFLIVCEHHDDPWPAAAASAALAAMGTRFGFILTRRRG